MANDQTLTIKINGDAKAFLDEVAKIRRRTKDLEKALTTTAKVSAAAFLGFATAIGVTTKAFADYETALVGVGKTTNIEGKKLEAFGKQFQKLSQEIPVSTNELLGIAQAAGQLGVTGEKNLVKFTQTIAKLGVATDLTGEQAAVALTRILNVTNENIDTIDVFGSVIVELGNNFAATESEIVRMATEVSRATTVFNVSAAESAALGTALKSVGVQAEIGGTATGKAFRQIDKAIRGGGKSLEFLSELTGRTGDDLRQTFQTDSVEVFQSFIEGLGRVIDSGGDSTAALGKLGLKGQQILKVLPALAKNSYLVADALEAANKETQNATALNIEADKAFATLNSTFTRAQNNLTNLAAKVGEALAPAIISLLETVNDLLVAFQGMDERTTGVIASFLKWGAIISGTIAALSTFALGALAVSAAITAIGVAFIPATVTASAFWIAVTGPIGLAIAGIAALTVGLGALYVILNNEVEPTTLIGINKRLDELLAKRKELQKGSGKDQLIDKAAVDRVDRAIKKLEDLRAAKLRAGEDFGTGELLIRPKADAGNVDLGASAFGIEQDQEIGFAPGEGSQSSDAIKKNQEDQTQAVDEATQKRIDILKRANAEEANIIKAKGEGVTQEEKDINAKRAQIENERIEANKIKNAEERSLAIESINLKHNEELAEIDKFDATKDAKALERAERQKILEQELAELSKEERAALTEEELLELENKVQTENDVKAAAASRDTERQIENRNQFLKDKQKHGKAVATINEFFRSEEIQGAKTAANQLVALTNSKNSTLKGIGKAAASVQAAIATGEGAIKAYSSLAGIPLVGPALGAAAAAAIIAYGAEQQSNILSANQGGFVPTNAGTRGVDSVPASLTPGELVVPEQTAEEVINATADARNAESGEGGGASSEVTVGFTDNAFEIIEQKLLERRETGVGSL